MPYQTCLKHSQEPECGCLHCKIERVQEALQQRIEKLEQCNYELKLVYEEAKRLRRQLNDLSTPDVWVWLGDENDDLNSMSDDMVVKIRAGDMRVLLSGGDSTPLVLDDEE